MSVNFQELLRKPVDSAVKPPVKPAGTYTGTIKSYKFDESAKQKTPYVRLQINNVTPGDDVDPEACEGIDFSRYSPSRDFYLTEDALYRLKDLIVSCGIPTEGRGFDETIPELVGMPVQFVLTQRAYETRDGAMEMANDVGTVSGLK